MKIRIKKSKILKESSEMDKNFPTTAKYRQAQPTQSDEEFEHASEQIQDSRIEIGMNIDRFLQRPFVTVGEEVMDDDGEMRTITDPKETNLLLYLYRGLDPDGTLLNGQDVVAVNRELNQRVSNFMDSLEPADQVVLASDIDEIITYLAQDRSPTQQQTHQSSYMLKAAPGHFDDYIFGARSRSVYKDTRAGKDFMLKKTPELKNIPDEHHFLFSMENLMGRVKRELSGVSGEQIPKLDYQTYDANYKLGTTTEAVEEERKPASEADKAYFKAVKNFFVSFYSDKENYEQMPLEQQIELMTPWFESLLIQTIQELNRNKRPENFISLIRIAEAVPSYFFDKYAENVEGILDALEDRNII